ncbi:carbohydrate kinase family protein [Mangrovitalea sediminis]|uniref:carbohydrate kinase family protein n=1 Tax=Mangrovitalea sediminis TaxID=1982043 RepID=UPI000BE5F964|nr:carbohydrate kinase family protein [Mangrovitalea sediminis]
MTRPLLIIGGTSVDTIVHLDELPSGVPQTIWPNEVYRSLGSTGAGKALNLRALGMPVLLHTLLGRDAEGDYIRRTLRDRGIELMVEETLEPTEQHVNLMDAEGRRMSIFVRPPATPADVNWAPVEAAMAASEVVIVNILAYAQPALAMAKALEKPIWTDLHDYDGTNAYHQPFIDAADVIQLSSDNLPDYRGFMEAQIRAGKRMVVCTHGRHGASLINAKGEWYEQPALPVGEMRDSNGAGDAFFSGLLYGHLMGRSETECLRLAAACGALCVASSALASPELNAENLQRMV